MEKPIWQFWIDVGGTFTDCLAQSPAGIQHQAKVLSSGTTKGTVPNSISGTEFLAEDRIRDGNDFWVGDAIRFLDSTGQLLNERTVSQFNNDNGQVIWTTELTANDIENAISYELDHGFLAPILAIRSILQLKSSEPIPTCSVHLGTTRGTNALLTRSGAPVAFVATSGFRDLLAIGDQARPNLFELTLRKPTPLFQTAIEIDERILADGTVERVPDEQQVRSQLTELHRSGIQSIAICLMHGFRFPDHERLVGQIAKDIGFEEVRLSSEIAPLIKIVPRAETTVLDAYLNPVIGSYLNEIRDSLTSGSQLRLMTSSGGLVSRERFSGKDSVLSGPAGGVVGSARVAQQAGFNRAIGFDMGGTSSDVARFDGQFELEFETKKAGVRIVTPMMAIETVAAGGGSICGFDGTKLVVGPESAGSSPGPACYGRGGPLAVTDINLFLGRIVEHQFPFRLDRSAVEFRLQEIRDQMQSGGFHLSLDEIARGFLKIANNNMSAAIRNVSVAKGYNPQEYVLVSFGGAGSQHACAVADNLGIKQILDHPNSSILSAVGIQFADHSANRVKSILKRWSPSLNVHIQESLAELMREVQEELESDHPVGSKLHFSRSLDLRYEGTDPTINLDFCQSSDVSSGFEAAHQQLYGYTQDRPIEVVAIRVIGHLPGNQLPPTKIPVEQTEVTSVEYQELLSQESGGRQAEIYDRSLLKPGDIISNSPAIIADRFSTVIIDKGWCGAVLGEGQILITRQSDGPRKQRVMNDIQDVDPIQLEIFNSHFASIARQMGISLQKTAVSVNVKERMDFSCAIFTGTGELVVNAPHIPVHLGAMSQSVKAVISDNFDVQRGDVFLTNDPYRGGSHLPDVTVVSPVFIAENSEPSFWVASRGHHAEIGGASPGSMPASATSLAEEGVLIQNFKLVDAGTDNFEALDKLLRSGPYPSRSPQENIADIQAQIAANRRGEQDLSGLVQQYSLKRVLAYMGHIQDAAEQKARIALSKMPDIDRQFQDQMDNGATIQLRLRKMGDRLEVDFSGTDPVTPDNLNANPAIVSAAVMYVVRLLITDDIPLNEGVLKPITIVLPECFLNPTPSEDPANSPAIVGGNVETSQRVVDVLLGALGVAAASCGSMNNWLIGDDSFGYYETVGGGSGATVHGNGADAVHTHMTNTRLTDPEILETRYPLVLRTFRIRHESGGKGKTVGGDGMIREIEFTKPLTLTLLTSRRVTQPFGLDGGQAGKSGQNVLIQGNQNVELSSRCEQEVQPGDRLRLITPGGGGFGVADSARQ